MSASFGRSAVYDAAVRSVLACAAAGGAAAPTANVGALAAEQTGLGAISLDGSGSTDNVGDGLTYAWTMDLTPSLSTATLTDADTATPDFTPDYAGLYSGILTVTDGLGQTDTMRWIRRVGPTGWVLEDMSTWTLDDPGGLINGGSTTWGTTSTVVLNTGLGASRRADVSRNGAMLFSQLLASAPWSKMRSIDFLLLASSWGLSGGGAIGHLHAGVTSTAVQSTAAGVLGGVQVQSGGTVNAQWEIIGSNPDTDSTSLGALVTSAGGAAGVRSTTQLNASGPIGVTGWGSGASTSDGHSTGNVVAMTPLIRALHIGVSGNLTVAKSITGLQVYTRVDWR